MTAAIAHLRQTLVAEFRHEGDAIELYFHVPGRGRYLITRPSEYRGEIGGNVVEIAPQMTRTVDERESNIWLSGERGLPKARGAINPAYAVAICGPGPGLVPMLDILESERARGVHIWALKGAWRALTARGIVPDAVVMLDAHPTQVAYTAGAPAGMLWLLSTMTHPAVFDALEGERVAVWDAPNGLGISVLAHAIMLAVNAGYRDIRLYGADCSWAGQRSHLYELANRRAAETQGPITAFYDGKTYTTTREMCVDARGILRITANRRNVIACGSGLLPDLYRGMNLMRTRYGD